MQPEEAGHEVAGVRLCLVRSDEIGLHVPVHLRDGTGLFAEATPERCQRAPVLALRETLKVGDEGGRPRLRG